MAAPAYLDATAYFALEHSSEVRHELIEGIAYAMAGGTPEHAERSASLAFLLRSKLNRGACRIYGSDLRVKLNANTYAYPDCTVICGELERAAENPDTVLNPTVVFEVRSDSTQRYDRGRKVQLYTELPSVQAIVIVWPDEPIAETIQRDANGGWVRSGYSGANELIEIPALGIEFRLGELYV